MTQLPETAFWIFSVEFYARPGVAEACLALQEREGVDVNLVLLGLWLGGRGHRLSEAAGRRLARLARGWQDPIVAPLRGVRRCLARRGDLAWAGPVAALRSRLGEVVLALEQVEQLLLEEAAGQIDRRAADPAAMRGNLAALGLGRVLDTSEVGTLLGMAGASAA